MMRGMGVPNGPLTLTAEQLKDLNQKLSQCATKSTTSCR